MSRTPRRPADDELLAFAEGRLDPRAGARVAAYIREHPEEVDRVRAYILQDARIREAYAPVLDEPVPDRLRAVVERSGAGRARFLRRAAGVAAAAGLAMGVATWSQLAGPGAPAPGPAQGDRSFASIVVDAYRSGATFDDRAGSARAPDLTRFGLELERVRSLERDRHRITEYTYRDARQRRVALYESRPPAPLDASLAVVSSEAGLGARDAAPGNLVEWIEGDRHFAVVGDRSPAELEQLALQARRGRPDTWPKGGPTIPKIPTPTPVQRIPSESASPDLVQAPPIAPPEALAAAPPPSVPQSDVTPVLERGSPLPRPVVAPSAESDENTM